MTAAAIPAPETKVGVKDALVNLYDKFGEATWVFATYVVDNGLAVTADRLMDTPGTYTSAPDECGWGTGTPSFSATSTELDNEVALDLSTGSGARTAGTESTQTTSTTGDTYQVVATKTASGPGTVTEAGIFDNNTIGSGVAFLLGDFTGIPLLSSDSIEFTCKAQFTN